MEPAHPGLAGLTIRPIVAHTTTYFLMGLLALLLHYWVTHPDQRWLNWTLGGVFVLVMLLPTLGLLVQP